MIANREFVDPRKYIQVPDRNIVIDRAFGNVDNTESELAHVLPILYPKNHR